MAIEIERKFLVRDNSWRTSISQQIPIRQGYLCSDIERTVRVRTWGEKGLLTVKSKAKNAARFEFEYEIPLADALDMLDQLCPFPQIQKTRFLIPQGKHCWEIDVFAGHNQGLVVAEIELTSLDENIEKPNWIGEEVTHDHRYSNSYLAQHSFLEWCNEIHNE